MAATTTLFHGCSPIGERLPKCARNDAQHELRHHLLAEAAAQPPPLAWRFDSSKETLSHLGLGEGGRRNLAVFRWSLRSLVRSRPELFASAHCCPLVSVESRSVPLVATVHCVVIIDVVLIDLRDVAPDGLCRQYPSTATWIGMRRTDALFEARPPKAVRRQCFSWNHSAEGIHCFAVEPSRRGQHRSWVRRIRDHPHQCEQRRLGTQESALRQTHWPPFFTFHSARPAGRTSIERAGKSIKSALRCSPHEGLHRIWSAVISRLPCLGCCGNGGPGPLSMQLTIRPSPC